MVMTIRILKAIQYIETYLNDDLSLAKVSQAACYSHYHFLRIFQAVTGITAGTYIRRRRLTQAAEALLKEDTRIIEIALDAGFDSQAAFSRAFKEMFDIPPARFRKERKTSAFRGQPVLTEKYLNHIQTRGITMTPRFEHKDAQTFIGMGKDCNFGEPEAIGDLWDRFNKMKHLITDLADDNGYGLCYAPKGKEGKEKDIFPETFRYTAALRVTGDAVSVPEGMEKINMPAERYAVFTHKGSTDTLPETNDYIWKTWLPRSGLELADSPDIELYSKEWDPILKEGNIEIYLPVIAVTSK